MTIRMVRSIANPSIGLIVIWAALLLVLLVGPINYPGQPSMAVALAIVAGVAIFICGQFGGRLLARFIPDRRYASCAPPPRIIERIMILTSLLGIVGILLIAVDRDVLSGLDNANYAAALRCAPEFIDLIQIRRTPLIYIGYLTFSFGFVSLALFLLQGEYVQGWGSYLAQASIISPVGYALLYSGRMPILLMITLLFAVGLVRLSQGRSLIPRGHYLLIKTLIFVVAFGLYVNAMWASRQNFCKQIEPVIAQLRKLSAQTGNAQRKNEEGLRSEAISAQSVARLIKDRLDRVSSLDGSRNAAPAQGLFDVMREAWGVTPRPYVVAMLDRGWISSSRLVSVISNYFYLTHGVMTLDRILSARDRLDPTLGVYEVGVLSPIIRVFFRGSTILGRMHDQLIDTDIYGFFPTVWGAAVVDFGIIGGVIYIFIWGVVAGWAFALSHRTRLVTPAMGLAFILASILLSPIQGPLGVANSALVFGSILVAGLVVDVSGCFSARRASGDLSSEAP